MLRVNTIGRRRGDIIHCHPEGSASTFLKQGTSLFIVVLTSLALWSLRQTYRCCGGGLQCMLLLMLLPCYAYRATPTLMLLLMSTLSLCISQGDPALVLLLCRLAIPTILPYNTIPSYHTCHPTHSTSCPAIAAIVIVSKKRSPQPVSHEVRQMEA